MKHIVVLAATAIPLGRYVAAVYGARADVPAAIAAHTSAQHLGILGDPGDNVLEPNVALEGAATS